MDRAMLRRLFDIIKAHNALKECENQYLACTSHSVSRRWTMMKTRARVNNEPQKEVRIGVVFIATCANGFGLVKE